jgi:hypothetical protein
MDPQQSSFAQLTDEHPIYLELKSLINDGRSHATSVLSSPSVPSDERHFYCGVLHNIQELDYALEERRKAPDGK